MKRLRLLLAAAAFAAACVPRTPMPRSTPAPATVPPTAAPATAAPTALPSAPRPTSPPPAAVDSENTRRHLRIFEQLWNTVDAQYVYPDFGGVDWPAAYDEFRPRVETGLDDEAFWQAMRSLIARLGDDHSTFLAPDQAREEDEQLSGELSYTGIGIYAAVQADRRQAVIFSVFPGGPADEAGLRPHDAILNIDGQPAVGEDGSGNLDLLRGPAGSELALRVRSPGQPPRQVRLTRSRVEGQLQTTGRMLPAGAGRRVGYMMIPTLWDPAIEDSARQTLDGLMQAGPLDGLIIDLRTNGGGVSTNLLALLGFFTAGQHGEFASRDQTRPLAVAADPIGNSQTVPLAVLVGPDTQSYAEVLAGVLREAGRARLVGTRTPGNIETIYGYDFEDGSRAWIARETFIPASGADWETDGLAPDVPVEAAWDEYTDEADPYLAAALDALAAAIGAGP